MAQVTVVLQQRIQELAQAILYHKRRYYQGKPEISDVRYDALEDELRTLDPQHPALLAVGTETLSTKKLEHALPMLSLAKTYKTEELLTWMGDEALVACPKVDGNSLSLVYRKGHLLHGKTRGDGRVGEDVTEKVRWIDECPAVLSQGIDCEVRGEVYCSIHSFTALVDEMLSRNLERPNNPRNIVAGLLGRKAHIDLCHHFQFYAFDVLLGEASPLPSTEWEKQSFLAELGFKILPITLIKSEENLRSFLERMRQRMEEDDVAYDGAVFTYNRITRHQELGATAHHPRYKMSFKWPGQTAEADLERIEWATSRLGVVTPVAVIKPIYLSGAQITNITLHNAEHVKAYNLKSGDRIEIIRSGEVIPKFLQVITSAEGLYQWPEYCPSCHKNLVFDSVRLRCVNHFDCPAQRAGFILNWVRCAEIDDLSDKRLEQMLQSGLIHSVPDLYTLTREQLLSLPATKEKMASKLLANIAKSKEIPLANFLNGMGIEGTGLRSWEKLLEHFPSLERLLEAKEEDICAIDGFAEKSARQIVLSLAERRQLIKILLELGVEPRANIQPVQSGLLMGKQFVITGTLSQPRDTIEKMIREAGGKTGSAVSKNTFALITNERDAASTKMKKALQLGVTIWSEDDLLQELKTK